MVEQKTEFRKIRDFGDILNNTFVFIGQNLGPLLKSLFAICAVFMVMQAIFSGLYQYKSFGILQEILKSTTRGSYQLREIFTVEYFIIACFPIVVFTAMQVTCAAYIKYYISHDKQTPSIDEVWAIFSRYFLKVLAYNVVLGLLMIIGFCFCLLPGIYLWVVFVPMPLIVMIEERGLQDAVRRCFFLVRDNFWSSFVVYLVSYLIYSFSGGIIGGIISVVIGLGAYLTTQNLRTTISIATSFLNIFTYAFYLVYFISVAFQYFNLTEQKDGTGILSKIESIGEGTTHFDKSEEQY